MSDLVTFIELGVRHITDLDGMDHILFLIALAAIYRPRDWRRLAGVVTAFTAGHSITLAIAVTAEDRIPGELIEFLIPVTIVATCIANMNPRGSTGSRAEPPYRFLFAGLFGLVHGAGFANYLRDVFPGSVGLPLAGFNIGIEIGQILVLVFAAALLAGGDRIIAALRRLHDREAVLRQRAVMVSLPVMIVAAMWAVERRPW